MPGAVSVTDDRCGYRAHQANPMASNNIFAILIYSTLGTCVIDYRQRCPFMDEKSSGSRVPLDPEQPNKAIPRK
jgi:hypothetical protein